MIHHKHVLNNGLRFITVPLQDSPTVTVLALVEAGSKYETKEESGISHFLEHMFFKGTAKRPKALHITKELDAIGADYNAFTSHEYTGYYAKSDYRRSDIILDVISDIYLNQTLPEAEIEKEKGVIVEEINMYQDIPQRHVQEMFMQLMYGDQPAGWNIAGTKETVRSMNREKLFRYRNNHYVPHSTVVVVAGNFDEEKMVKEVQARFGVMLAGEKHPKIKVVESQEHPQIVIQRRTTDQVHLVLGTRAFNTYDSAMPALKVLSAVLGGGMSSRLFQQIREELGLGYYIKAGIDSYTDHGLFEVLAGVDRSRVHQALSAILKELRGIKEELVPDDELKKSKEYLIGSMMLSLDSSDSVADFYGYQEIMKKPIKHSSELAEEIQRVTAEDVRSAAERIFVDNGLNLAAVGDASASDLRQLLTFTP